MPEKDPSSWTLFTWILAVSMSMGGGFVSWYQKYKFGNERSFSVWELIGEIATSLLSGLGMFMAAKSADFPEGAAGALAGLAGHMGSRMFFLAEKILEEKAKQWLSK